MKISKSKLKQLIAEELTEAFGGHAARVRHDPASHSHADAVKGRGRPDPAAEREREREKKFRKQHQSQKADMMKQNPWLELEEGEMDPSDWEQEHPSFNTGNQELNQAAWRKVAKAWEEGFEAGSNSLGNEENPYAKFVNEADLYEMVYDVLMEEIKRKK